MCFTYRSTYMSIPVFQLTSPQLSPWLSSVSFLHLWLYFCFVNKSICTISLDSAHSDIYDIASMWNLKSFLNHCVCQTNHLWKLDPVGWLLLPSRILFSWYIWKRYEMTGSYHRKRNKKRTAMFLENYVIFWDSSNGRLAWPGLSCWDRMKGAEDVTY